MSGGLGDDSAERKVQNILQSHDAGNRPSDLKLLETIDKLCADDSSANGVPSEQRRALVVMALVGVLGQCFVVHHQYASVHPLHTGAVGITDGSWAHQEGWVTQTEHTQGVRAVVFVFFKLAPQATAGGPGPMRASLFKPPPPHI